jgi:hypothetical protein
MQMHDRKHNNPLRLSCINYAIGKPAQTTPPQGGSKRMPRIGIALNEIKHAYRFQQKRVAKPGA